MAEQDKADIDWSTRDTAEGLDAICRHFYPWCQQIASRWITKHPGSDHNHIRSSAGMALLDAVRKFEPGRGVLFTSFATYKIVGAIIDSMRAYDHLSKTSRGWIKQRVAAEAELLADLHRTPLPEEVCERLGWSTDQYWLSLGGKLRSIYAKRYSGDNRDVTLADNLVAKNMPNKAHSDDNIEDIMRGFSFEEKAIVYMHYFRGAGMKEIAAAMNINESRVCQIHKAVIERLKQMPDRFQKGA